MKKQPTEIPARRQTAAEDPIADAGPFRAFRLRPVHLPRARAAILERYGEGEELPVDVDQTRHARYWTEAFNGVAMRMALLALVLGAVE